MDAYTHEKEQIDQIKQWWKENWLFLVGGLVLAIGGISGWRAWQAYELERAEAASSQYKEMLVQVAAQNADRADATYSTLKNEYGDTVYALLGALQRAENALSAGDRETAMAELAWAMESGIDRELQLLARLRLARVQLAGGDEAAALKTVAAVAKPGRFTSAFEELKGDAHYFQGDVAAARAAYQAALDAQVDGGGDPRKLQLKIDNLAMPVGAVAGGEEAGE
ncbi:MAG: tetratricopeptide repeat protein [Gammaproteobacteria bacterium]|nr:tetratricopeptide repeat protein [Gammaproteobacteria bacterium]